VRWVSQTDWRNVLPFLFSVQPSHSYTHRVRNGLTIAANVSTLFLITHYFDCDGRVCLLTCSHTAVTDDNPRRKGSSHLDVASCQLQARSLEVAPAELKITTPRTGDRPKGGGRCDRAVVHGGGAVASGTERGVRVAAGRLVGTPGRVAVSSRYPPGRVIGRRPHYPADRVTGTACYPCSRVTSGIGVTLQTPQPGNHVGWCYPARAAPTPNASPSLGHRRFRSSTPHHNSSSRSPCNALVTQRAIRDPSYPARAHGPHHGSGSRRADPTVTAGGRPDDLTPLLSPPGRPFRHRNPEAPHSLLK
jgi:hypothetical protein